MDTISRRRFMEGAGAGLAASLEWPAPAKASPLGLPIGLQLYSVGQELAKDFDGTLRQVAAIGYAQVEFAGFMDRPASAIRRALEGAGLGCIGAHYSVPDLQGDLNKAVDYAGTIGLRYMICAFPRIADPRGQAAMTLDDWKWNADLFNKVGAATKRTGIQFATHNHNLEFRRYGGALAYDELIRRTDPDLVKLELDCGWAAAGGQDPAKLLLKYPGRFRLLHVKDVEPGLPPNTEMRIRTTEIGRGALDWRAIFAAARQAGIAGYYVELEPPYARPPLDETRTSYAYLRDLRV